MFPRMIYRRWFSLIWLHLLLMGRLLKTVPPTPSYWWVFAVLFSHISSQFQRNWSRASLEFYYRRRPMLCDGDVTGPPLWFRLYQSKIQFSVHILVFWKLDIFVRGKNQMLLKSLTKHPLNAKRNSGYFGMTKNRKTWEIKFMLIWVRIRTIQ